MQKKSIRQHAVRTGESGGPKGCRLLVHARSRARKVVHSVSQERNPAPATPRVTSLGAPAAGPMRPIDTRRPNSAAEAHLPIVLIRKFTFPDSMMRAMRAELQSLGGPLTDGATSCNVIRSLFPRWRAVRNLAAITNVPWRWHWRHTHGRWEKNDQNRHQRLMIGSQGKLSRDENWLGYRPERDDTRRRLRSRTSGRWRRRATQSPCP